MGNVLFVDDDTQATRSLVSRIQKRSCSHTCHIAHTSEDAIKLFRQVRPEVAVVDLSLDPRRGPESGLALIEKLLQKDPCLRILVLTGHGAEHWGIKALQSGAASFLEKPINPDHLIALIEDGVRYSTLHKRHRNRMLSDTNSHQSLGILSKSNCMQKVIEQASFAVSNNQAVLILGETGTGKGVLAQALHLAQDNSGPFIRFQPNYGSTDLAMSELFGHVKGAFTGATGARVGLIEAANKGTLFLDEVDELSQETQVALLNVLQEKTFRPVGSNQLRKSSFRLICASNRKESEIKKWSKLREDFFHRISHITINLPPLRERIEDIPLLAEQFVQDITTKEKLSIQGLCPQTIKKLCSYDWPGNIRELQATVHRAVFKAAYSKRRFIEAQDLELSFVRLRAKGRGSLRERVKQFEIELAEDALIRNNNNQTLAARSLQLDRSSFRRILQRKSEAER